MATLKITNLKTVGAHKTDLWETGLKAVQDATALRDDAVLEDCIPECNTKEFEGTIEIPVYGNNNQYIRLSAGEEKTIVIGETEAEKQFYLAMASDTLAVEPDTEEVEEEEIPETPVEDETPDEEEE